METQTADTPVAPVTPPPAAEPSAPIDAPESIASHAEQFNPPKLTVAKEPDDRPRHRAKSQQATAADVPRINELTRKLREAEAELARYRTAPAARVEPPSAPSVKPTASPVLASTSNAVPGFTDPEPTLEQFSDQPDPYAAWLRATARWERKKDAFEEQQASAAKEKEQASQQESEKARAAFEAKATAYNERLIAFRAKTPDFDQHLEAASAIDGNLTDLLTVALIEDDNGPEILYHLITHPLDLDEMRLLTEGKPVSAASVASLRRRLRPYAHLAAPTGSAASVPSQVLAPRPPNPVRTGPMHTDTEPSGEQGSISAHERAFSPNRRR